MPIEDVFTISGRGTVVTGRVERGIVKVGDEIEVVGLRPNQATVVTGVEMFRKVLDEGQAGDNVGVLLRGTKKEDVERGMVLSKPKSSRAAVQCERHGRVDQPDRDGSRLAVRGARGWQDGRLRRCHRNSGVNLIAVA